MRNKARIIEFYSHGGEKPTSTRIMLSTIKGNIPGDIGALIQNDRGYRPTSECQVPRIVELEIPKSVVHFIVSHIFSSGPKATE